MSHDQTSPFVIDVPESTLTDLRDRLAHTRWPTDIEGIGWEAGTDLDSLKELTTYWRDGSDCGNRKRR